MSSSALNQQLLTSYLERHGASTSAEIQIALKASQPTVSRLISTMPGAVVPLGRGRSRRYAAPQTIGGLGHQQPIWLIDETGQARQAGTLSLLAKSQIHVEAEGLDELGQSALPWYLSPLRAQGFLGRLLAQRLAAHGIAGNPESWDLGATLFAALHLHDAPGSILLGHGTAAAPPSLQPIPSNGPDLGAALEALAQDVARSAPAGSSAGGEQPKFLVVNDGGEHFIAKFSPPRGTPFGDRWHDLLHAESLCMEVLARHGHDAARCQLVEGASRTFLLSHRFDRAGRLGRRHVVAIGAVHAAFVAGAYNHWASTADALARQGRLPLADAQRVHFRLQFGRLTGNSDMHSGNLSLFAQGSNLADLAIGQFTLAPVYDMLPMRWRPDPMVGAMDYSPFAPDDRLADAAVRLAAFDFWTTLAKHPSVSTALKDVAKEMALRMGTEAA